MKSHTVLAVLFLTAVVVFPGAVHGDTPAEAFADGKARLAQGDFNGALTALASAVKADSSNREYVAEYKMVRRVVQLRKRLETETDPERWQYMALALRSYYVQQKIYPEAQALDRKVYAKQKDAPSAVRLAETLLAMNQNAEAAEVLSQMDSSKATQTTKALLSVAMARDGKIDRAKAIAREVSLPKNARPGMAYSAARMYAAIGHSDKAIRSLNQCFESIPPSLLDGFKNHAKVCPDFAGLVSTEAFAKVLATKSKLAESKCSGGSKCAGCPMRQNCSKEQK